MEDNHWSLKKIVVVLVILGIAIHYFTTRQETPNTARLPPVLLKITDDPVQENLSRADSFSFRGYTITPLADFTITARVLSRENYYLDRAADLSPADLALGWGPMADSAVLDKISISQSGRWYHWHVDEFPIPRREIETHSANMHMIPADSAVAGQLTHVHKDNIISLHGKLVRINANDGWHWQSSLTRDDTGDGSCEVIWVESLAVRN
jgi:hypothetical protein